MPRGVTSEIQVKPNHSMRQSRRRSHAWRKVAAAALGTTVFLVGVFPVNHRAFSQQPSAAKFDFEGRRRIFLRILTP